MNISSTLQLRFEKENGSATIPNQRRGQFKAKLLNHGIEVDCLGSQKVLPWKVFMETITLLNEEGGTAIRGNVRKAGARLGDLDIPTNSVEGRIAQNVYDIPEGKSVFMRISPIANILVWAGICSHGRGSLKLV